jgi:hypothetical protein
MRFVLVNGRAPRPQCSCALCCDPIEDLYLRYIATRSFYCSQKYYLDHRKAPALARANRARAS